MKKIGLLLLLLMGVFIVFSCDTKPESNFTVDFSYEINDGNMVHFSNTSEGEYYSMTWDFGNGELISTTDKNEIIEMYYPLAGSYNVTLKLGDYLGNTENTTKVITLDNNDLVVSFTAEVDAEDLNTVNLVNTSEGSFDSFTWKYRKKEIEGLNDFAAYFPFSGNYQVELELIKGSFTASATQSITIAQNDPDYLDKLILTWSDEFDGPEINPANWTYETGAGGWGNNELQEYTNGFNAEIVDGILILTAKKLNENKTAGSYTSTRMITRNKNEFTYGNMEIRAKLPSGTGIWPAIWMLGSNISQVSWPKCGEIDIMEYVGYEPNIIHATVHTLSGSAGEGDGSSKTLATCEEEFHIYGLNWTEEEMVFYTDSPSNVTHIYNPDSKTDATWPFDLPQFFILNVAVGGDWGGALGIDNTIFPQSMEIDYIKVFQEPN